MKLPLLLLLSTAMLATAQDAEQDSEVPDDWYRVELLVFANQDPEAALSETWPLLPELAYPEHYLLLREGSARAPADRTFQLETIEQTVPDPAFDLAWDTPIEELWQSYHQSLLLRRPDVKLEPLFDLDVPVPYTLLSPEQREFGAERRKLDRSSSFTVLYHESWLQPMLGRAQSTPLVIGGGTLSGDFSALQGSILIYRSRYLHLETSLWLNTAGSYLTTDSVMPAPPLTPTPEAATLQPFKLAVDSDWLALQAPAEVLGDIAVTDADTGTAIVLSPEAAYTELPVPVREAAFDVVESDQEAALQPLGEAELKSFMDAPQYGWHHALLLQQKRRMRGGELHYIDHPVFGVLIKVSRHEFAPFVESGDEASGGLAQTR